ncbi:molybdenum cofactor guanylyltransferase [Tomitella gaofuii]|uniref:molybdenum cofactor guanylyltransferase n=1 Tax=Tomitella gaofuii TaxID=2760083 RepID=UPI001F4068E3|nr:molybdenum cofactor guanylyltransferase [Tomitella gaofuii]
MTVHAGSATAACGVVLAGGRSRRMGRDKATMAWGGATMLESVVAVLRARLPRVFVVAADGQRVPAPAGAEMVVDSVPDEGPLRGLEAGLRAGGAAGYRWAFVAATDMPLLTAAVVGRLLEGVAAGPADASGAPDAVIAVAGGRDHPLAGVYRTALAEEIDAVVRSGRRSMRGFLEGATVHRVVLGGADARAVFNVNTPADARAARGHGIV